jgi:branched-chain amino acid transport system ATP-binding protein
MGEAVAESELRENQEGRGSRDVPADALGRLEVSNYAVTIGHREVVRDISFATEPGRVTAIVGHNGAGKTTLLSGLLGLLPSRKGRVVLDGHDLSRTSTAIRARRGLALVPDRARGVFADMTVAENLALSKACSRSRKEDYRNRSMDGLVERLFAPVVLERRQQLAGSLSGGQRQMLAIAAALSRGPSVLMLDEPSLGLAPVLVEQVLNGVRDAVTQCGISCVLVEQNVGAAMRVADLLLVLKEGAVAAMFKSPDLPTVSQLWDLF